MTDPSDHDSAADDLKSDRLAPDCEDRRNFARPAWVAVALGLAAAGVYLPTVRSGYINLDDFQYVIDNAYVLVPSPEKLIAFFSEVRRPGTVAGYYQPLTMASLMFDRVIDGWLSPQPIPRPIVFHVTNILLHGLNTALVFLFLRRLGLSVAGSALAGLLFGVHPLHVESVAWISQRKTLLATLFALLMFLAYHRYERTDRGRWLVAAGGLLILSLLSKPTTWSLPFVLLLLDVRPYRRLGGTAVAEKIPLFLIVAVFGWIAYVSQAESAGLALPAWRVQPVKTILVACHNVVFYLSKTLWPAVLCPQYPMPELEDIRLSAGPFALGAAGVAALAVGGWMVRRRPGAWSPMAGFVLLLAPVLGAVHFMGSIAADRFAYLPMIALLPLVAGALDRAGARRGWWTHVAHASAAFVAAALAWQNVRQQAVWRDSMTYWSEVIRQYPDDAGARDGLGSAHLARDDLEAATSEYERAIQLRPMFGRPHFRLAEIALLQNRAADGERWALRGLELVQTDADGWFFLGLARSQQGRYREAIIAYRRAVEIRPSWREALFNLANALLRTGAITAALPHYQRLNELAPGRPEYLYNHGVALMEAGRPAEAYPLLVDALRFGAQDSAAFYTFAACAAAQDRLENAWLSLETAVKLDRSCLDLAERNPHFARMRADPRWQSLQAGGAVAPRPPQTTAPRALER